MSGKPSKSLLLIYDPLINSSISSSARAQLAQWWEAQLKTAAMTVVLLEMKKHFLDFRGTGR
jgi:hypothetical protein